MKQILLPFVFFLFLLPACKKSHDSGDALGSWKLIQVYDKSTGITSYAPSTSNMDVVITFIDGNSFAGHTLRNSLTDGSYRQNGNEIIFKSFSMTKIAEDQWGGNFLTVLNACTLQSVSPCAPSIVTVQGDLMKIQTPLRYDITLKKI